MPYSLYLLDIHQLCIVYWSACLNWQLVVYFDPVLLYGSQSWSVRKLVKIAQNRIKAWPLVPAEESSRSAEGLEKKFAKRYMPNVILQGGLTVSAAHWPSIPVAQYCILHCLNLAVGGHDNLGHLIWTKRRRIVYLIMCSVICPSTPNHKPI